MQSIFCPSKKIVQKKLEKLKTSNKIIRFDSYCNFFLIKKDDKQQNYSPFRIESLDVAFGGLGSVTIYLHKIHSELYNKNWSSPETLLLIQDLILQELGHINYSVPGGMPSYRRTLAVSFFTRFWHQTLKELNISEDQNLTRNLDELERDISEGNQDFGTVKQEPYIGTTNPHCSGLKQTTGVAK